MASPYDSDSGLAPRPVPVAAGARARYHTLTKHSSHAPEAATSMRDSEDNSCLPADRATRGVSRLMIYLELSKVRLSLMVLVTTAVGFVLAAPGDVRWARLFWAVLGTGVSAFGANALNQWWERRLDALMDRTCTRPLPSHRLQPDHALMWGFGLAVTGPVLLAVTVNDLAALLAVLTIALYVLVYTPLKTRTSLCTLVGAVCGALPPMIGWAAASGRLSGGAWFLAAILFFWQIPHFLALAWMYRDDYSRGGFRMLPVFDQTGAMTCRVAIFYTLALLALGPVATLTGLAGPWYGFSSILLGLLLLVAGVGLYVERSRLRARRLFLASLIYLPSLLGMMLVDQGTRTLTPVILAAAAPR